MARRAVIWDLDQTLVDSKSVESLRRQRQWKTVMARLDGILPYAGLAEIVAALDANGVESVVVTSSPKHYAEAVLARHYPSLRHVVGYHDSKNHKPHPDPIRCGLERIGAKAEDALSIGDAHTDILASRAAGVGTIGVTWGSANLHGLAEAKPDNLVHTTNELLAVMEKLRFVGGRS